MGIAERRIQLDYDTQKIPKAMANPDFNVAGVLDNVKFEINWDSFNNNPKAYQGLGAIWQYALEGIRAVCCDKLGQEALRGNIKKIVIQNVTVDEDIRVEFTDGVLTGYVDATTPQAMGGDTYQTILESSL